MTQAAATSTEVKHNHRMVNLWEATTTSLALAMKGHETRRSRKCLQQNILDACYKEFKEPAATGAETGLRPSRGSDDNGRSEFAGTSPSENRIAKRR